MSMSLAQSRVQEAASVQVQAMAMSLDRMQEQGAAIEQAIAPAQAITDPLLGQNINVFA